MPGLKKLNREVRKDFPKGRELTLLPKGVHNKFLKTSKRISV